ncbi:MAG: LamG-like jellyroll fold domain-containing protein [Actinoplanes sp.]
MLSRALLAATILVIGGTMLSSAQAATTPGNALHYTFDGDTPLADVSGHGHDLTPVSRNGGAFSTVAHGAGSALAFPPPCDAEPCPRIALRAPTTAGLNPGRRPIRYGASVRLSPDETTKGENVLQKGYSASGSQYKLQIDGAAGRPSCVLVGDQGPEIHLAASSVGVADDRWHTLECRRSASTLTILVDGVQRGATTIPAALSIRNRLPFSVGGKGSFTDNDQFQGILDEVWLEIQPGNA